MGISSSLHKSYKSVAHIGSKHRRQAVSAIRVCHTLENLDLPAETPPQVKETIMIQIQQIVQTTYHAVLVAADATKSVEVIEQELANIAPQVGRCIEENADHIPVVSVENLREEVIRFETAKKQDQKSLQETQKLANKVLSAVPKFEKTGKEHDFYVLERSKLSTQHMVFHLDEHAKLPEIVWRFQRKYRQWCPTSRVSNPHFYPEVTSIHLERGVNAINPLSDYNRQWTRGITVIGDDLNSRFKLEDSDSFVMYEPVKNLTNEGDGYFFKDTKARLHPPRKLDSDIRQRADGLVYYFWEEKDNSFIKAYKVRSIGELVKALNIPAETKDEIRRKAREKAGAISPERTLSPGTSHPASSPSPTPPSNNSLTSIEVSTDSPGTNSDIIDSPSQTTIPTSATSISNLPSSVSSASVQSAVSKAPSRNNNGCNTITLSDPTGILSKHRSTQGVPSTQALNPTTPSVAPSAAVVSSGVIETTNTATPTSSAAGTLMNTTPGQASAAAARPWWQKWVDPLINLVAGTRR